MAALAADVQALKGAVASNDTAKAARLLSSLKARPARHSTLCGRLTRGGRPPGCADSVPFAATLARPRPHRRRGAGGCSCVAAGPPAHSAADSPGAPGEVFEQAVLLSVALRDGAAFERNFAQLQPYYTVARCVRRHSRPPAPVAQVET